MISYNLDIVMSNKIKIQVGIILSLLCISIICKADTIMINVDQPVFPVLTKKASFFF